MKIWQKIELWYMRQYISNPSRVVAVELLFMAISLVVLVYAIRSL